MIVLPETVELPDVAILDLGFHAVKGDDDRDGWIQVEWSNPDNLLYGRGPFLQRLDCLVRDQVIEEYDGVQVLTRTKVSPGAFVRYRDDDHYARAWVKIGVNGLP